MAGCYCLLGFVTFRKIKVLQFCLSLKTLYIVRIVGARIAPACSSDSFNGFPRSVFVWSASVVTPLNVRYYSIVIGICYLAFRRCCRFVWCYSSWDSMLSIAVFGLPFFRRHSAFKGLVTFNKFFLLFGHGFIPHFHFSFRSAIIGVWSTIPHGQRR